MDELPEMSSGKPRSEFKALHRRGDLIDFFPYWFRLDSVYRPVYHRVKTGESWLNT